MQLAQKMGFSKEAVLRWDSAFPVGKEGMEPRAEEDESTRGKKGRDTIVMAVCWDEWEAGLDNRISALLHEGYAGQR